MTYKSAFRSASLLVIAALLVCGGCVGPGSGGGGVDPEKGVNAYLGMFNPVLGVRASPGNGGRVSAFPSPNSDGTYKYGDTVTVTAAPNTGYAFKEWSGASTDTAKTVRIVMDGNKALIANFIQTYKLTVMASPAGRGTVSRNPDKEYYTSGESVTVEAKASGGGYAFDAWSDGIRSSGRVVVISGNETLTAYFKPEYTITFDANGGTGTPPTPQTAIKGSTITLPDGNNMKMPGGNFNGWNIDGIVYPAGSAYIVSGDATAAANWNATYTVTFNLNGGSVATPSSQTVPSGTVIILPLPTKPGNVFIGWGINGSVYPAGSAYTVSGNATVAANWSVVYTVTFNLSGVAGSAPSPQTETFGVFITLPLPNVNYPAGMTFGGWSATATLGGGAALQAGSSYRVTENITLYAKWVTAPEAGSSH